MRNKKKKMLSVIVVTAVIAGLAGFGVAQATSDVADQPIDPPESVTTSSDDIAADTPTDALPADASQVSEHVTSSADAGTSLPSAEITPAGSLPLDTTQVVEHIDSGVEDPPTNPSIAGSVDATARQLDAVDDPPLAQSFVGSVDGLARQLEGTGDDMLGMVDSSIPPSERFPG